MHYEPILGIIGNVGPEADEFLQKLIRLRAIREGACRDQDFLPMLVVKNPLITDRTLAIFENGPSPVSGILESCKILEAAGCFLASLPSNTSHYYRNEYQAQTPIYIIDIIAATLRRLHAGLCERAALLGTTPTIETGVFQNHVDRGRLELIAPASDDQETLIQSAIYGSRDRGQTHAQRRNDGIKSGRYDVAIAKLLEAVDRLSRTGVQTFVSGCTEISIVCNELRAHRPGLSFVDPMECLADESYDLTRLIGQMLSDSSHRSTGRAYDVLGLKSHEQIAAYVFDQMRRNGPRPN